MPPTTAEDAETSEVVAAVAIAGAGIIGAGALAGADPVTQQGLVDVNLTDVSVQVPVAVAANVCDVKVAVLVQDFTDASAPCTASADPTDRHDAHCGGRHGFTPARR